MEIDLAPGWPTLKITGKTSRKLNIFNFLAHRIRESNFQVCVFRMTSNSRSGIDVEVGVG